MGAIQALWPLYGLRLRTGDLELRLPDEELMAELAELTREPIHDPATMPFFVPWTDAPADERVRSTLQWHWRCRGQWSPESWRLELVALRGGVVVGTQGVHGTSFAVTREVETGSWVGGRHQGQGVGSAMRRAVLHLAFAGLGAVAARSGAFSDNPASLRVSERCGYRPDGTETKDRRGERATIVRLLLTREEWEARSASWPEVTMEGVEQSRALFGVLS